MFMNSKIKQRFMEKMKYMGINLSTIVLLLFQTNITLAFPIIARPKKLLKYTDSVIVS